VWNRHERREMKMLRSKSLALLNKSKRSILAAGGVCNEEKK
jgi:hypothetical protein